MSAVPLGNLQGIRLTQLFSQLGMTVTSFLFHYMRHCMTANAELFELLHSGYILPQEAFIAGVRLRDTLII